MVTAIASMSVLFLFFSYSLLQLHPIKYMGCGSGNALSPGYFHLSVRETQINWLQQKRKLIVSPIRKSLRLQAWLYPAVQILPSRLGLVLSPVPHAQVGSAQVLQDGHLQPLEPQANRAFLFPKKPSKG